MAYEQSEAEEKELVIASQVREHRLQLEKQNKKRALLEQQSQQVHEQYQEVEQAAFKEAENDGSSYNPLLLPAFIPPSDGVKTGSGIGASTIVSKPS
jgi:hypothetical protein